LRRNAGVTVQWLRRNADAVETGNCVADEQADRFNNGLGGQICRSAWVRNKPTAGGSPLQSENLLAGNRPNVEGSETAG
jgi:hypothetical protein